MWFGSSDCGKLGRYTRGPESNRADLLAFVTFRGSVKVYNGSVQVLAVAANISWSMSFSSVDPE